MGELFGEVVTFKALNTDDLNVDEPYQRCLVPSRVNSIAKEFKLEAFGCLLVGKRRDGSYWVVDGQQRLGAARKVGIQSVTCAVFKSKGRKHEAAVFKLANSRTQVTAFDNFRASLEAGSEESLTIQRIVEQCGFSVSRHKTVPGLKCVTLLEAVYRSGFLEDTLVIARKAWPNHHCPALCLGGIWRFLKSYGNQFRKERLVKVLSKLDPMELVNSSSGDAVKFLSGGSRNVAIREIIRGYYNRGLTSKNKIELPEQVTEQES